MSDGFIIAARGSLTSFLEWIPAQQRFAWLAAFPRHATVLTQSDAEVLLNTFPLGEIQPDPFNRKPAHGLVGGQFTGKANPVASRIDNRSDAGKLTADPIPDTTGL